MLSRSVPHILQTIRLVPVAVILFFAWLMLELTLPYMSFRKDVDFLLTKQGVIHHAHWRWAFYVHITTSIFVLVFGALQFVRPVLRKAPRIHRALGKGYVGLILLASGPSGLIMAFYANGGLAARSSFILLTLLWMAFTLQSYLVIRKGKVKQHTQFMIRSYALTLSAITLRLYSYFLPMALHLRGAEAYIFLAWASWVPNLLIAEILIRSGFMSRVRK